MSMPCDLAAAFKNGWTPAWARVTCGVAMYAARSNVVYFTLMVSGNDVDCFVVMPNHVHALIAPAEDHDLSTVLHGVKGVSARCCNKLLGRKGKFWMDESYNHIVRDPKELDALRDYITSNPKKAGLKPQEYSVQMRNILTP